MATPQNVPDAREKRPENVPYGVQRKLGREDVAEHHRAGHQEPVLPTNAAGGVNEIGEPLLQEARLLLRKRVLTRQLLLQLAKPLGNLFPLSGCEGRVLDVLIGNSREQLALKLSPQVGRVDV
jgi:hypothetical protein